MSGVLTSGLYTTNDILGGNNMSGLFVAPIVIDNDDVTLSHDVVDWFVILLYGELVSIEINDQISWCDFNHTWQNDRVQLDVVTGILSETGKLQECELKWVFYEKHICIIKH